MLENDQPKAIKDTHERVERFKRLAKKRTLRIIKLLGLLENCANKTNYSYTDEQVVTIFTAIEDKIKEVRQSFSAKNKKEIDLEL